MLFATDEGGDSSLRYAPFRMTCTHLTDEPKYYSDLIYVNPERAEFSE
jgi:hypothetical protein